MVYEVRTISIKLTISAAKLSTKQTERLLFSIYVVLVLDGEISFETGTRISKGVIHKEVFSIRIM